MNIRIELPEVLYMLSSVMFVTGSATIGWTFFSLASLVGICRFGINQAEKIEENKNKAKLEEEIKTLLTQQDMSAVSEIYPKLVH